MDRQRDGARMFIARRARANSATAGAANRSSVQSSAVRRLHDLGAFSPTVWWLVARASSQASACGEQPLAFAYAGEYSPKAIAGRISRLFTSSAGRACADRLAVHAVLPRLDRLARGMIVIGIGG